MKKQTFFEYLETHSEAKLNILDNYVVTWMRKITMGPYGSRALVIDGFAGSGKYENADGSPIRLINHVINFCEQSKQYDWDYPELLLLFIEDDETNYKELLANIQDNTGLDLSKNDDFVELPNYPSVGIACVQGKFAEVMENILSKINNGQTLIPSFCFIDPFGFKDTPFEIIRKYLENEKSEIFLNFIYEETNRFIRSKNEKVKIHMKKHFGTDDIESFGAMLHNQSPEVRKQLIVDFYSRQLLENTNLKHVLSFEIKKSGRTKLILFYGTKSVHGLKVMKKAMWNVDDTGMYMFDDRKKFEQIEFDFVKELTNEHLLNKLSNLILDNFTGQIVTIEELEEFVITDTIFPVENFLKKSLKRLESSNHFLDVKNRKNKGTFPAGTVIKFK